MTNQFDAERAKVAEQAREHVNRLEQQRLEAEQHVREQARQHVGELERQKHQALAPMYKAETASRSLMALGAPYISRADDMRKIEEEAKRIARMTEREREKALGEVAKQAEAAKHDLEKWQQDATEQITQAEIDFRREHIEMDTGEFIRREDFRSLPSEQQAQLKQVGVEAFNRLMEEQRQQFGSDYVQLQTGEYVAKDAYEALSPEHQQLLQQLGPVRFQSRVGQEVREFKAGKVEVEPGLWIPVQEWDALTEDQKQEILRTGASTWLKKQEAELAEFTAKHVEVRPGEWYPKSEWESLTPSQQQELLETEQITFTLSPREQFDLLAARGEIPQNAYYVGPVSGDPSKGFTYKTTQISAETLSLPGQFIPASATLTDLARMTGLTEEEVKAQLAIRDRTIAERKQDGSPIPVIPPPSPEVSAALMAAGAGLLVFPEPVTSVAGGALITGVKIALMIAALSAAADQAYKLHQSRTQGSAAEAAAEPTIDLGELQSAIMSATQTMGSELVQHAGPQLAQLMTSGAPVDFPDVQLQQSAAALAGVAAPFTTIQPGTFDIVGPDMPATSVPALGGTTLTPQGEFAHGPDVPVTRVSEIGGTTLMPLDAFGRPGPDVPPIPHELVPYMMKATYVGTQDATHAAGVASSMHELLRATREYANAVAVGTGGTLSPNLIDQIGRAVQDAEGIRRSLSTRRHHRHWEGRQSTGRREMSKEEWEAEWTTGEVPFLPSAHPLTLEQLKAIALAEAWKSYVSSIFPEPLPGTSGQAIMATTAAAILASTLGITLPEDGSITQLSDLTSTVTVPEVTAQTILRSATSAAYDAALEAMNQGLTDSAVHEAAQSAAQDALQSHSATQSLSSIQVQSLTKTLSKAATQSATKALTRTAAKTATKALTRTATKTMAKTLTRTRRRVLPKEEDKKEKEELDETAIEGEHVLTYTPPKGSNLKPFAVVGRRVPFPGVITTVLEVPVEVQVPLVTPVIVRTPIPLRIDTAEPVEVSPAEAFDYEGEEEELEPTYALSEPELTPIEAPEIDKPAIDLDLGDMDFAVKSQDFDSLSLEPIEIHINGRKPHRGRRHEPDAEIKYMKEV